MGNSKKKKKQTKNLPSKENRQTKIKTEKPAVSPEENSNFLKLLLAGLAIALVTFFVYRGSLDNDFVDWDDYAYVIQNNLVRSQEDISSVARLKSQKVTANEEVSPHTTTIGDVFSTPISLNYHPLTILTMRWNNNACPDCMNGISARPFILWNVILHILNALLVLLLVYKLTDENLWAAAVVAAIFALHPMHVESVAWVSERKDVLYTFFLLGGLITYVNYLRTKSSKWIAITFVLFVCACLSKAMAVVFPLLMLLIYYWENKTKNPQEALVEIFSIEVIKQTIPFFLVSLFFGLMASKVQGGNNFLGLLNVASDTAVAINDFDTFSLIQRFQFACYGFTQYIIRFFVPHDMSTFHPYPSQAEYDESMIFTFVPLVIVALLVVTFLSLRSTKAVVFGLGFYFVTVALVLQFVSVGVVIMADRYTYLPYIGLAFMLVMLVVEFSPQKLHQPIFGGMLVFSLLLGGITIGQIETWEDSDSLWTHVIDLHTIDGRPHANMEQPLSIRGNYYGKRADYFFSVKGQPEEGNAYIEKAFNDFVLAEKMGSKRAEVYEGLGNSYGMKKNYDKALAAYSKAIQFKPENGSVYFNRGVTYSILRKHQEAIADYTKALELAPSRSAMAWTNRGISYVETGQKAKAIADFNNVLKVDPNNQIAKRYLNQLGG